MCVGEYVNSKAIMRAPGAKTESGCLKEQSAKWYRDLKFLIRQTHIVSLLIRHPAAPWHAKVVAACMLGYLFSPIQLVPNFIPVIGQLDDLAIILMGMKLLRTLTPGPILADCESKAGGDED